MRRLTTPRNTAIVLSLLVIGWVLFKLLPLSNRLALPVLFPEDYRQKLDYQSYTHSDWKGFTRYYEKHRKSVESASLDDRCRVFLRYFIDNHPDYEFSKSIGDGYLNHVSNRDKFKHRVEGERAQEREYRGQVYTNARVESDMADAMGYLRIYSKCMLNEGVGEYSQLTSKLLPFLSGEIGDFPESDFGKNYNKESHDLIQYLHQHQQGRGIVISASNSFRQEVARLVRVLRALNNRLPIEIIHRGDLNDRTIEIINTTATADVESLLGPDGLIPTNNEKFRPDIDLLANHSSYHSEFPPQYVRFVNIKDVLTNGYQRVFKGYSTRGPALMFSSFKEAILMDADSVLLVPPEQLFDSPEYKKSGTYFFKDRTIMDTNSWDETNMFAKLMPQAGGLDELFGYAATSNKTLGNRYMVGWRHLQESGVVVLDKQRHFGALLALNTMLALGKPLSDAVWGDKELYWISMAVSGDEDYEFNQHSAAAVGQVSDRKNQMYDIDDIVEVCSSHPGHIDSSGNILWINSGMSWCKKNSFSMDQGRFPYREWQRDDVVDLYAKALSIRAGVVPPEYHGLREVSGVVIDGDTFGGHDFDEMQDDLDYTPVKYLPTKGWNKNPICSGYHYCAYNSVNATWFTDIARPGKTFDFSNQGNQLDYLAKVWFTGTQSFTADKVKKPEKPKPVIQLPPVTPQNGAPVDQANAQPSGFKPYDGWSKEQQEAIDEAMKGLKIIPNRPNPGHMPGMEELEAAMDDMNLAHWKEEPSPSP
ncbi:hypothetical protein DIURU_002392 [Diutina rugosa]|uniref:Alpha-1,3-mannosyltransferase n=1 Tax=Diutina rugosa TaxID=5481 RepID=A0A642UV23_DIURU|nr:uncharacterized protein DIURU_002392 [Diutina rugosa]KAA8903506.1 hypothetical protein DIURU_002392 [Diutina rugosa]